MVFRRRSSRRPRRFPRRSARRVPRAIRSRMRPVARRMSSNMHKFVRWHKTIDSALDPLTLSCNFGTSGVSPMGMTFRLDDVSAFSEFVALYDQYKILNVKVYFDYSPDVGGAPGSAAAYPKLWVKRDYDDAATPTLLQLAQSNQTKCLRFNDGRTTRMISLRPAVRNEVYRSSTTTAYTQQHGAWLDMTYPDVPHHGLKLVAQGLPGTNLGAFTIRIKYTLLFKNVR